MGSPEMGGLREDILSKAAVCAVPESDPLIARAYEMVRALLRKSGIEPTHDSRVAFADDPSRHDSLLLDVPEADDVGTERVALVQAWEVGERYNLQIHLYDRAHPSVAPLLRIDDFARETLTTSQRTQGTNWVAWELSSRDFAAFLDGLATLKDV